MALQADPAANTDSGTPAGAPAPQQSAIPEGSSQQPPAPAPEPAIPTSQVDELLAKVRKDEKDKLYPELERSKSEAKSAKQRAKELEAQNEAIQQELESVRTGKATEFESVNRELRESREKIQKLETAIEDVATQAIDRVRRSELAAYRAKRIAEVGISLPELVSGDSEEDIDRAIKSAKEKEDKLLAKAREDARRELGAQVPRPLSPDGTPARLVADQLSLKNRQAVAQKKGSDYEVARQQLLLEAKQKAGLL